MGKNPLMRPFRGLIEPSEGVAAVEFALLLPFMLLLYVGSLELSQLIVVDRRVGTITGTVGDLVSRVDGTISNSMLTDYFKVAEKIITPFPTVELKQVVTCLEVSSSGVVTVKWSKPYNGATAHAKGDNYALPTEMINVAKSASKATYVIVSETAYAYTPLLGIVFDQPIRMYRENFYLPRYGEYITEPA